MNQDLSAIFEIAPEYFILDSCWLWGLLRFFQGILARSSRYNVIWIKSSIPVHFSSFIPQMSIFTLSISCLITSNLPWFMDLTVQVPRQYCILQHRTLLSSPDPSTAELHFLFGQASSFFLELLVIAPRSSPIAHWTPFGLGGGAHLPVSYLFAFSYCSWGSHGKNTRVASNSLLQFCQNSPPWPSHLEWPGMAWFIALLSYASSFATTWVRPMKERSLLGVSFICSTCICQYKSPNLLSPPLSPSNHNFVLSICNSVSVL